MANKKITEVDTVTASQAENSSVFINDGSDIKQISKAEFESLLGITTILSDLASIQESISSLSTRVLALERTATLTNYINLASSVSPIYGIGTLNGETDNTETVTYDDTQVGSLG